MGRYIVKLGDYYLEWSTVVDAPITYGMSLEEFKEYYRQGYGEAGMQELPGRLERVEAKGTSSHVHDSAEDVIGFNRAGPGEMQLTPEGIYRHYCLGEELQSEWIVPEEEEADEAEST